MSDTPKKTTRPRKATAKADAQKDKAAAPKDDAPQAERKDDKALREAVLLAALPHAAFDGFIDSVLEKAGKDAGVSKLEVSRLFEGGPAALVEFYSVWADDQMEAKLAAMDLKAMKIRMRIAAAVWARLDALKPHKEAARRAAAMLSLPMNAALGAKLMYRTVDAMWRSVGDTSTDFNFYTKRAILGGVYGATAMRWFTDDSDDQKATEDFLAARIDNVMQFEKLKAKTKEAFSNFPAFADWAKPK